jgi:hypothetical protein
VGLSNGQACGSCTTLSLIPLFFRPTGHYVRDITLVNRNISSVYHIVAIRVF